MTAARRSGTKGVARADREAQILDVAGRVFGAHGYVATSVADIARRAEISKPLIYQYFGSKDGLFERCVDQAAGLLAAEIERSAQLGAVGLERALVTLDGVFVALAGRPWIWAIANDPTAPGDGGAAVLLATYRARIDALAREGVAEMLTLAGEVDADDLDALTTVWGSVFDSLVTWWCAHPDVRPEQMSARCRRLFRALGV